MTADARKQVRLLLSLRERGGDIRSAEQKVLAAKEQLALSRRELEAGVAASLVSPDAGQLQNQRLEARIAEAEAGCCGAGRNTQHGGNRSASAGAWRAASLAPARRCAASPANAR